MNQIVCAPLIDAARVCYVRNGSALLRIAFSIYILYYLPVIEDEMLDGNEVKGHHGTKVAIDQ